ncbi:M23 family metallopeptidase [Novosphingobium sp.]|uniref:M23 family metallopeptidase n=1 Tax=Novosphingobium sp. TaxID=1874826 RepID=UPI002FDD06E1
MGLTGHTTGPHTHVVMRLNGKPVDPMRYIGQNAPSASAAASWDKASAYAAIDKADMPLERKQRAKAAIDQEFARKDAIDARAEREADDEAKRVVIELGDRFTSFNQIPQRVRDAMSVDALSGLIEAAKAKSDVATHKAQENVALNATLRMYNDPDGFMRADVPKEYMGKVSPSDFARIVTDQAKMRKEASKPQPWDPFKDTSAALSTYLTFNPISMGDGDKAAALQTMKAQADAFVAKNGRAPSSTEWYDIAKRATRTVKVPDLLWGAKEKPLYQASPSDAQRAEIVQTFKQVNRRAPTDDEVLYWFRQQQAGAAIQ